MRRIPALALLVLFSASTFAATPVVTIKLTGLHKMIPDTVKIHVGDTVEWLNIAVEAHTVTADPAKAVDPEDVEVPRGAEIFDSGDIQPQTSYAHTFTVAGKYRYVCQHHEEEGMKGEIDVE